MVTLIAMFLFNFFTYTIVMKNNEKLEEIKMPMNYFIMLPIWILFGLFLFPIWLILYAINH